MAVLCSAAARSWRLSQVTAAMRDGTWPGLARLYARYPHSSRAGAISRDWKKAVALAASQKTAPTSHTRQKPSQAPGTGTGAKDRGDFATLSADERIWAWRNAIWLAERDPERRKSWGGAAASIRVVLRALAAAMQIRKSATAEFGVRDLSLHAKIPYRTTADALAVLRDEEDPLVIRTRVGRGLLADQYLMRLPDAHREDALWHRWRSGIIAPVHRAFWILGAAALLTYEVLTSDAESVAQIARHAVLSAATVRKALGRLAEQGMAVRDSSGWRRGPASPDHVARATGADQADQDTRDAYTDQRDKWKKKLSNRPEPPGHNIPPRRAPDDGRAPGPESGHQSAWPPRGPPTAREAEDDAMRLLRELLGAQVIVG
jgi:predicted transcriptional regulator